jgi:hypothetical protein
MVTDNLNKCIMTANDFASICANAEVSAFVALENKRVVELLKKDKKQPSINNQLILSGLLQTEF